MHQLFHAVDTFFSHLAAVEWRAVGIALLLHFLRLVTRAFAWRSIIAAAYPDRRVPLPGIFGAYLAGVGVNSIVPARSGDAVKLVLAKRQVHGSTYTTLAPTLLAETLLDTFVAGGILLWALTQSVLPGIDVLPSLPTIDWSWPIDHPRPAIVVALVWVTVIALLVVIWTKRVRNFGEQFRTGFAILRDPRAYLTRVASWQALSWLLRAGSVWFFLDAFDVPATARNVALVLAVQSLSTLLPFTPGGIGTQQGFLVYAFRNTAIPRTTLISFSVGMHIATNALNVLLGLAAMLVLARSVRWKQIVAPERREIEEVRARR